MMIFYRARNPRRMLISSMGVHSSIRRIPANKPTKSRGPAHSSVSPSDLEQMAATVAFTARSLAGSHPRPFGASIVHTNSGKLLLRALNRVAQDFDHSSHAEVRAIRLATKRLKKLSLAGYTLYTTCEPCPMCMSTALWAGIDRVVYGAKIADANKHCKQIQIPAVEVAARSDMQCIVDGPVLRDESYALFTHPRMLQAFRIWSTRK